MTTHITTHTPLPHTQHTALPIGTNTTCRSPEQVLQKRESAKSDPLQKTPTIKTSPSKYLAENLSKNSNLHLCFVLIQSCAHEREARVVHKRERARLGPTHKGKRASLGPKQKRPPSKCLDQNEFVICLLLYYWTRRRGIFILKRSHTKISSFFFFLLSAYPSVFIYVPIKKNGEAAFRSARSHYCEAW